VGISGYIVFIVLLFFALKFWGYLTFYTILLVGWAALGYESLSKKSHLTIEQKKDFMDVFESVAAAFVVLLSLEIGVIYFVSEYIKDVTPLFVAMFFLNIFLIFLFRKKDEDKKTIKAAQKTNFDFAPKKVRMFKRYVKDETDAKSGYYALDPILKKSDYTVSDVRIAPVIWGEYEGIFLDEVRKEYEPHKIYKELIDYYNNHGKKYGLKKIDYKKFNENFKGKKRIHAEMRIVTHYLNLVEKGVPIRISQLLQISDEKYMDSFIYFLMGLPSRRFVPKSIFYAIHNYKHNKNFSRGEK
jgi:hypothetical protein